MVDLGAGGGVEDRAGDVDRQGPQDPRDGAGVDPAESGELGPGDRDPGHDLRQRHPEHRWVVVQVALVPGQLRLRLAWKVADADPLAGDGVDDGLVRVARHEVRHGLGG